VSTAAHTAKYGASVTINCQVKDGTGAAAGNVALAGRVLTMTVSREFDLDSVGTQDGNIVLATSTVALTDATGAASFTVAGPADPSTGTDRHIDTIVITCADACNHGVATTGLHSFMTDGGLTLTHTQNYVDTTADAAKTVLTSSASSGLIAATAGITRLVTATVYDQYGDTVAGETVTFTATQDLPSGLVCTAADPSVCTSLAAHGLADGDTLSVVDDTRYRAIASTASLTENDGSAFLVGEANCVGTVTSTTAFQLEQACGTLTNNNGDTASAAATPHFVVQTNPDGFTAAVTRVTSSAGSASYSWSDKHSVSGAFVTTATGAGASAGTHTFYRLDAGATFTGAGGVDSTLTNGDTTCAVVEFDAVGQDFTCMKLVTAAATHPLITYQQYSYDANDQFSTGATVTAGSGTPTTMALWVTDMATNAATGAAAGTAGVIGDIALAEYQALSTGVAKFKTS
jgi:hypothetical protein